MKRALLISMPFATTLRPSIGLSLLKAALNQNGIPCDVRYLNISFAEQIGGAIYEQIAGGIPQLLLGESIFAADVFGERIPPADRYVNEFLSQVREKAFAEPGDDDYSIEDSHKLLELRSAATRFLDDCLRNIPWDDYALVGFSTTFQQNLASLALARRVKEQCPDIVIVFGGANCEGEMGLALHRLFPFIDYVCTGEADLSFPLLAKGILANEVPEEIAGVIRRVDGQTQRPRVPNASVQDMDSLPYPNYDDFVEQYGAAKLQLEAKTRLYIETSRGCWWGQKSHCTFCGLNGSSMQFRAKSSTRALDEIGALVDRYQMRSFVAVDNIIDMRYFRDALPRLKKLDLDVDLFYETKANLSKAQVRMLREAGVLQIQPGIESLNSNVLRLMRKGVSVLQNIQLLRWLSEFMVLPVWNMLAGFPGENPRDYARQAEIVPLLTHLTPPVGLSMVRLDRFSPLFFDSAALGACNVRAAEAYSYVYPFSPSDLSQLAYYHDFDYADGCVPQEYLRELQSQVRLWTESASHTQLTSLPDGDTLVICDTRSSTLR